MELLSNYSFNLYYVKGKGVTLTNVFAEFNVANNAYEIIPIPFNVEDTFLEHYHTYMDHFRIQTGVRAKQVEVVVPNIFAKDTTSHPVPKANKPTCQTFHH